MRATILYADTEPMNTSHYRCLIPAKYLRLAGHEIETVRHAQLRPEQISDVMLVERELNPDTLKTLRACGAKRIIVTFDDAYHLVPREMNAWHYWCEQGHLAMFRKVLQQVEGAVAPSRLLADDYGASYLPNYLDPDLWPAQKTPNLENRPLVIGWGGSRGHVQTWRNPDLAKALKRIVSEFPNVEVRVYGTMADDALFQAEVPFKARPWVDFENWPDEVRQFDIGLAPLTGEYDMRRSNLKLLEYGAAGVPFVATDVGEYRRAPGGILVVNRADEWYRALKHLIRNDGLRASLGSAGRKWVEERWFMPDRVREYERILWPGVYH